MTLDRLERARSRIETSIRLGPSNGVTETDYQRRVLDGIARSAALNAGEDAPTSIVVLSTTATTLMKRARERMAKEPGVVGAEARLSDVVVQLCLEYLERGGR